MESKPYSVYIDHRPIRIAFLVNPDGDQAWIDRIIEYNREKWGGRFNPIIFTDGKNIKDKWWKFLKEYDPDIIKSTMPLEDDLLKKIRIFLTPYSVEVPRQDEQYIHISDDPVSIFPTKQGILQISRSFMDDAASLVMFDVEKDTPDSIKKFLERNFGVQEDNQSTPYYIRKSLRNCDKKIYKIKDFESLNEALLDLGDFHNRIVFPSQICSIPNYFKDTSWNNETEKFTVVIGDTPDELAYLWNRALQIKSWLRQDFTCLWLSNELANNEIIKPGLTKLFIRFSERVGNDNYRGINFVSFSLSEQEITTFSSSIDGSLWRPRQIIKYNEIQIPNFDNRASFFILKRGLELYRAHSEEEHIIINEPNTEEGVMGGQHWVIDLHIQYRPELFENIQGIDYWWQLPRRANIFHSLRMFNKETRINEDGMFSIKMRRKSHIEPDENILVVRLPQERGIFHALTCGDSYDFYKGTDRERFMSRPFDSMQRSDKGMYLSGILSLFPDLLNAHYQIEDSYWRSIFEKMSNRNANKDPDRKTEIKNKLKKIIDKNQDYNDPQKLDYLAEKVLVMAKNNSVQEVEFYFKDFLKNYTNDEGKKFSDLETEEAERAKNDIKDNISGLIEQNILLAGIKPRCPRCGYRIWYHINETQQHIDCKGCGHIFSLDGEERWSYKLNSLVRSAFSLHGTIPVLLALGQLQHDARSSFIFFPGIELISKDEEEKIDNEIDLICIKDGKFIIGEIKQTIGLFCPEDFKRMEKVAKLIKPDKVIFSSLDKQPTVYVNKAIESLRNNLKDLEIEVEWYQLHF